MNGVSALVMQTVLPGFLVGLYTLFLEHRQSWKNLPRWARELILGVAFGLASIFATLTAMPGLDEWGLISVSCAAPLVSGLLISGPSGIVAGTIGGVFQWACSGYSFLDASGMAGLLTTTATSVAIFLAGITAAALYVFVFRRETPAMGYVIGSAVFVESLHMMLLLVTNMNPDAISSAFNIVQHIALPTIVMSCMSTAIALIGRGYINEEHLLVSPPRLINDLGVRLFAIIAATFLAITWFTVTTAYNLSASDLSMNIISSIYGVIGDAQKHGWQSTLADDFSDLTLAAQVYVLDEDGTIVSKDSNGEKFLSSDIVSDVKGDLVDGKLQANKLYEAKGADGTAVYLMAYESGGYTIVGLIFESSRSAAYDMMVLTMVFMEIIVNCMLFCMLYLLLRSRVVNNLSRVEEGLDAIADGNLETTIDVRSHQEFSVLSDDVNATVGKLRGYIEEAEHRHDADLQLGRQIQHSALPSMFPAFPERHDFDLFASMDAAREVGGDFYDFFMLDGRYLVFLVADVSGKGVPAALFMMKAKAELHALVESGMGVDEAMTRCNESLCEGNDSGMFVTAWLGKLELATGTLAYANAGHNPPLLRHANGDYEYLRMERPNLFLAGMDGTKYRRNVINIEPDDRIFLYTDGVTEAYDPDGHLFGEDKLLETLNAVGTASPRETCEAVRAAVAAHANGAEQSDDVTMVSVEVRALRGHNRIVTRADMGSVDLVRTFFDEQLPLFDASASVVNRVQVTVDEIYSNICRYSGAKRAIVSIVRRGADLVVEFIDDGESFDPTAAEDPDITLAAKDRPIGGLGILMVKRMTKAMVYERLDDDTNMLSLTFGLE